MTILQLAVYFIPAIKVEPRHASDLPGVFHEALVSLCSNSESVEFQYAL